MIHKSGAAYADQGDTCLGTGTPWGLRCHPSEVLVEVVTIDVLPAPTRPL
jgi:hypothetical protein